MSETKKPDAPWQQLPGKMKLDLWSPARNEIHTVGIFGWVWQEGNSLLAGPGPEFGNADPASRVVACRAVGLWWPLGADGKITETGYSDFDVQPADPLRFGLADLVEAASQLCGTGEDSEYNRALIDLVELMLGDEMSVLTRRKSALGLLGFSEDGE
jgi:hypothetical protein